MKKSVSVILILASLIISGCNNPKKQLIKIQNSNIDPVTGNLIVLWIQYHCNTEKPVIVTEPYAVYMEWRGDFKLFYLYDNIQKITYKTTNFDIFLEGLVSLPQETEIQQFDSCTATRLYDIPRSKSEKLMSTLSKNKLRWATSKINGGDKEIFCTCADVCESSGLRYP